MKQLGLVVAFFVLMTSYSSASDALYDVTGSSITDGRGGRIAELQRGLNAALGHCGLDHRLTADGVFGSGTKRAVKLLSTCAALGISAADRDAATTGTVTEGLWQAVLPDADFPTVEQRTQALVLAYEATDYGHAEWNFCQNRPLYDPANKLSVCFSNDRRSYLTWGPKGATAGHGQEIFAIAAIIDEDHPGLIDEAFGAEAGALRKAMRLGNPEKDSDLERFLCGVWIDQDRRTAWRAAFSKFGADERVRDTYDRVYRSTSFDGGKIETFLKVWRDQGLEPTEIDFAYFVDRSAHMSIREDDIRNAVRAVLAGAEGSPSAAEIRRAVSLKVTPSNQKHDRLGRDVAFYVDALQGELSKDERRAWNDRGSRRASNVGLSDDRPAPDFSATPKVALRPMEAEKLSTAEREACPDAVLNSSPPS